MIVVQKLALAGTGYVRMALSLPGTVPTTESLLLLLFFQSAGQSSFCLLLIDNAIIENCARPHSSVTVVQVGK